MTHVLIVDDEPAICWAFRECLNDEGCTVDVASSAEQALETAARHPPDVIVLDIRLPGMDGFTAMQEFRSRSADVPVIVMTAFGSLSTAVRAIDGGAFDYLTKPIDLERALHVVRQAAASTEPAASDSAGQTLTPVAAEELIVGSTPAMQQVYRQIALVAERDIPVLITGESGTGKDLVARAIHQHSRRSGPFVPICVPALSDTVVESELFGHVRGAFTGAEFARQGLLEQAHAGTAFIDEIGEIPLALQVKLLRVLETREIQPVGSGQCVTSSFRLVAATNRRLEEQVSQGQFREDLFYRLNVFRIHLPPLRERRDDIPLLANTFLRAMGLSESLVLSPQAVEELCQRPWYGNVRELRNAIESASIVCRGDIIKPEHLPRPFEGLPASHTAPISHNTEMRQSVQQWVDQRLKDAVDETDVRGGSLMLEFLQECEPVLLNAALEAARGNRALAAKILGIHRETLREKLRRYESDHAPGSGPERSTGHSGNPGAVD